MVRRLIYLVLFSIILFLSSCKSTQAVYHPEIKKRAELVVYAEKFLGTPYHYGGITPKGFDCSGYVSYVFSNFGYKFPRSSNEIMKAGVKISEKNAQPGDLIFFTGRNRNSKQAGHVGIITDVYSGKIVFIHASTSSGVRYDNKEQKYYKSRFLQIRRVIGQGKRILN